MRTDAEIMADLDRRFSFADGPVKIIDPRKVKLAEIPPESPVNASETIGLLGGHLTPVERAQRARALKRPIPVTKEACQHPRFTRIGEFPEKKGVARCRVRCTSCGKETNRPAVEYPLGRFSGWREKV